jgi:hypothetical protein
LVVMAEAAKEDSEEDEDAVLLQLVAASSRLFGS